MFLHVCEARHLKEFQVELLFSDGRQGVVDLAPVLTGPMFEPLRDPSVFAKLRVDDELQTITWPNGADLAPEYLYFRAFADAPELRQQFVEWGYLDTDGARTGAA